MKWLSYGAGVNSTALAILLCEMKLTNPDWYEPWEIIFADTGCEKQETYKYIENVFKSYLNKHNRELIIVKPTETVLERWQRLRVVGSRLHRACTREAKINPIRKYIAWYGNISKDIQLVGIDAEESHRVKEHPRTCYPLVDENIDRDGCIQIIKDAGLCVPEKSGCWFCPFMRVSEIINLAQNYPDKFQKIVELEKAEAEARPDVETRFYQWGDKPATYWFERAKAKDKQMEFSEIKDYRVIPCECYDG